MKAINASACMCKMPSIELLGLLSVSLGLKKLPVANCFDVFLPLVMLNAFFWVEYLSSAQNVLNDRN